MSMQDPISDMLTRLRNAQMAGKKFVEMPGSKLKAAVAKVLEEEGYIGAFNLDASSGKPRLSIELRYFEGKPVIAEIHRVSVHGARPGHDGIGGGAQGEEVVVIGLAAEGRQGAIGCGDLAVRGHRHVDERLRSHSISMASP